MRVSEVRLFLILLAFLGSDAIAQRGETRLAINPIISSEPLIPLDSLVPPRSQRAVSKIIICGSCGHHGVKPVYILSIKGKSAPLPMKLSDKVPASSIEAINILTRKKARSLVRRR